ncbi:hypothetical protein FVE85_7373 [Porphyridium purpureum]|uniref:Uncharacterized protein n=1 Tax=Porphyridium purpureum TaxID=35688 RepID=A0A5J4Z9G6_PORPP|nr:hypothetical protein FVE85_7373 [Porphyridium purpureum]|eukprot:POR9616..scf295_1
MENRGRVEEIMGKIGARTASSASAGRTQEQTALPDVSRSMDPDEIEHADAHAPTQDSARANFAAQNARALKDGKHGGDIEERSRREQGAQEDGGRSGTAPGRVSAMNSLSSFSDVHAPLACAQALTSEDRVVHDFVQRRFKAARTDDVARGPFDAEDTHQDPSEEDDHFEGDGCPDDLSYASIESELNEVEQLYKNLLKNMAQTSSYFVNLVSQAWTMDWEASIESIDAERSHSERLVQVRENMLNLFQF